MLAAASLLLCLAAPQQPAAATPRTIHGRLLDGEMEPAADVAITVMAEDEDDVLAALAKPLARSAADGTFAVTFTPTAAGQWLVVGGQPFATHMEELHGTDGNDLDLEFGTVALAPGTTMVGRVRGADGALLAGARIVADDLLPTTKHLSDQCEGQHLRCRTRARSDAHGVFKLPGMMLSAATLRLSHDGYFDEVRQPVAIGDPLDVTLQASPTVNGIVLDNDDKPVAGVTVRIGMANAKSDDAGSFSLSLRNRNDTAWASRKVDDNWQRFSGKVKLGEDLRLRPTYKPGPAQVVRVQARTQAGEPVPQFDAFVSWNPENQLPYRPDALLLFAASKPWGESWYAAAIDGTATLQGQRSSRDDTALVFVFAKGFAMARVQTGDKIVDGPPVLVTLAPEAVIKGRVVDATTGTPIAGAELIATQRLTDSERGHYQSGFRDVETLRGMPTNVKSGADGSYELRGLPPGALDLFVFVPGRVSLPSVQFDLKPGETREGIDWSVPSNVRLQAVLASPIPTGLDVRLHWERQNMWSSSWNGEFDHATHVAADGSFAFAELHPKPYQVQALLPAPPRGGHRVKQPLVVWNGAQAGPEVTKLGPVGAITVHGKVRGTVPWQRLAVAALPDPDQHHSSDQTCIDGPFALLASDRSYRLPAPAGTRHLLLFDPVTGVALEWSSFDRVPESQEFAGLAQSVVLQLVPADDVSQRRACPLGYVPDADHQADFLRTRFGNGPDAFRCAHTAFAGDIVTLWLPARSGTITIGNNGGTDSFDVAKLEATTRVMVRVRE